MARNRVVVPARQATYRLAGRNRFLGKVLRIRDVYPGSLDQKGNGSQIRNTAMESIPGIPKRLKYRLRIQPYGSACNSFFLLFMLRAVKRLPIL